MTRLLFAVMAAAGLLTGCGRGEPQQPRHGWVLHSQLRFFAADLQVAHDPLPRNSFRLFFPYIAGDLYGPATTGDFIHPVINPDLSFDIDFSRVQQDLNKSLQPTDFSLDYLKIEPPDARLARLAPLALQPDGIEQVATTDWIDATTRERLMLVYVDRPARITGAVVRAGYTIRYNIRAAAPGYLWIARRKSEDGDQMYTEVEKPESVILALSVPEPASGAPQKVVLRARTGTPVL